MNILQNNLPDITKPFFAYGVFRPGEISFLGIKDYVDLDNCKKDDIFGYLSIWDGMSILCKDNNNKTSGYIINFKNKNCAQEAYSFINDIEPIDDKNKLYNWDEDTPIDYSGRVNLLVQANKFPETKNNDPEDWPTIWLDPFFNIETKDSAISILLDYKIPKFDNTGNAFPSFEPLFDLQMHYLMLWTVIERFVFFRYGKKESIKSGNRTITESLFEFSKSDYFQNGCKMHITIKDRKVFSSDKGSPTSLFYGNKYNISYYYQVRNNITHRGKGRGASKIDYNILSNSFSELRKIMEYVLKETKAECDKIKEKIDQNYEKRTN